MTGPHPGRLSIGRFDDVDKLDIVSASTERFAPRSLNARSVGQFDVVVDALDDDSKLDVICAPAGRFSARSLNARMWADHPHPDAPRKLAGCGRPFESSSWVPVLDVVGRWRGAGLASCRNAWLCDACWARMAGESRDQFEGVFTDWFEGGGRALHVRVAVPNLSPADSLAGLLDELSVVSQRLVRSSMLRELIAPDGWVRRAHLVDNRNGWFPHHHFVCLVPPGDRVTEAKLHELEMSWKGRLGATKARAGRRAGLFARVVESVAEALYAWTSGAPGRGRNEWEPDHGWDDHLDAYESGSEWERDDEWRSDSVWDIADRALAGDQRAYRRWEEAGLALRGKRVVQASQMMRDIAATYAPEVPAGFEVTPRPVLLVASSLWERARWHDCTDDGLRVGREQGVSALASFWGDRLSHPVEVADRDGVPAMWLVGRQPAEGGTIAIIDYEGDPS